MSAHTRARLLELLTKHSYQKRDVVLASGKKSDFFIDCKQTVLTAEGHALAGELILLRLRRAEVRARPLRRAAAGERRQQECSGGACHLRW